MALGCVERPPAVQIEDGQDCVHLPSRSRAVHCPSKGRALELPDATLAPSSCDGLCTGQSHPRATCSEHRRIGKIMHAGRRGLEGPREEIRAGRRRSSETDAPHPKPGISALALWGRCALREVEHAVDFVGCLGSARTFKTRLDAGHGSAAGRVFLLRPEEESLDIALVENVAGEHCQTAHQVAPARRSRFQQLSAEGQDGRRPPRSRTADGGRLTVAGRTVEVLDGRVTARSSK